MESLFKQKGVVFVGYTHQDLLDMVTGQDFIYYCSLDKSFGVLRDIVGTYLKERGNGVVLVDCNTESHLNQKFGLFLKLLEVDSCVKIWFYNLPLTLFPSTVLSRCYTKVRDNVSKELGSDEFRFLSDYKPMTATALLQAKQAFVSFLVGLENASPKDFNVLMTHHLDKSKEFSHLLHEWFLGNQIFSERELNYCGRLRDSLVESWWEDVFDDLQHSRYILPLVISYMIFSK